MIMNVKIHKKDCKLISEIYKKSNKIMISKVQPKNTNLMEHFKINQYNSPS